MVTESTPLPTGISGIAAFLQGLDGLKFTAPLSERGYIYRGLAFASTGDLSALYKLNFELTTSIQLDDFVHLPGTLDDLRPALFRARDQFVEQLETIREARKKAHVALAQEVWEAGQRMVILPTFVSGQHGVEVHYRHLPADLGAALGYVLILLLDSSRPFGRNLCRCKLPVCQRFFLAIKPPTGRPRRDYCSQEHLEASRKLTGVERVQRFRERKKAEAAKKSWRKAK